MTIPAISLLDADQWIKDSIRAMQSKGLANLEIARLLINNGDILIVQYLTNNHEG